jgi:negative regulator of replication initiation
MDDEREVAGQLARVLGCSISECLRRGLDIMARAACIGFRERKVAARQAEKARQAEEEAKAQQERERQGFLATDEGQEFLREQEEREQKELIRQVAVIMRQEREQYEEAKRWGRLREPE